MASGHSTQYSYGSGCFPLCEECWEELGTPQARMPFYRDLWESWQQYGPLNGVPMETIWEQMKIAVMNEENAASQSRTEEK
jgi:hypothetical protein